MAMKITCDRKQPAALFLLEIVALPTHSDENVTGALVDDVHAGQNVIAAPIESDSGVSF
jgi:hypothetical protein